MSSMDHGTRKSVRHDVYHVHMHLMANGLGALALCDDEYPPRVAYSILSELMTQFAAMKPEWVSIKHDSNIKFVEKYIEKCQNPAEVDKIFKIQEDLDKTIEVLKASIDSIIDRGHTLDKLVKESEDLGLSAKLFYKNAAQTNKCCNLM
jgi:synaptobrevin family protein YKT6